MNKNHYRCNRCDVTWFDTSAKCWNCGERGKQTSLPPKPPAVAVMAGQW